MKPIEGFYASPHHTNDVDWSTRSKEDLIKHLRRVYQQRGEDRGIACPLPPDWEQRNKQDLIRLARHYYNINIWYPRGISNGVWDNLLRKVCPRS